MASQLTPRATVPATKRLLRLFVPLLAVAALAAPLPAQPAGGATVALITNAQGAHLPLYMQALGETKEVGSVVLADPSGTLEPAVRKAVGARLIGVYPSALELFRHHHPSLAIVTLEPKLATKAIDEALDAGCNVMAEKPAVLSAAAFGRLAAKAEKKHLFISLALANRINPEMRFARDLVAQGRIGQIYGVELHIIADQTRLTRPKYHEGWMAQKARVGGGHLIWLGIHWADLAMFVTGSSITQVSAFTANIGGQPIDVEDSAVVTLKFDKGFLGTMTSGFYLDKSYHTHLKIWGSAGWIELNPDGAEVPYRYYSTKDAKPKVTVYTPPSDFVIGYTPFIAACVRASVGLEPPPVSTQDSLRVLKTIYAAYHAAESGRVQDVASE